MKEWYFRWLKVRVKVAALVERFLIELNLVYLAKIDPSCFLCKWLLLIFLMWLPSRRLLLFVEYGVKLSEGTSLLGALKSFRASCIADCCQLRQLDASEPLVNFDWGSIDIPGIPQIVHLNIRVLVIPIASAPIIIHQFKLFLLGWRLCCFDRLFSNLSQLSSLISLIVCAG